MQELRSHLGGRWVSGRGPGTPLHDPATGARIATASTEGLDLAAALAFARATGGPALRALTFAERGGLLAATAKALHAIRDDLIRLSTLNTGTTRSDSKFDVDGATATLGAYAEIGAGLGSRRWLADGAIENIGRSPRFAGGHVKMPLRGVAVHINAFNFPLWGFAEKFACAILAGMPVLTKPATGTALPSFRAADAVVEAGVLPPGAWSFLAGGVGDLLAHLGPQDVVAFTGSAATGRRIRALPNVIEHSVRVNVEADSLNAVVVGPDVEPGSDTWSLFQRELVREITQKTGQKCTATRRVLLPGGRIEDAVAGLREKLAEFPVGPPDQDGVRVGPLATPAQLADVVDGLKRLAAVAEPVIGRIPDAAAGPGAFVEPVVFVCRDPDRAALVHDLEVFGPACTILPYGGSPEEAAGLVARGGGGLVATVYSDDLDFVRRAFLELAPYHGRILLCSAKIAEHSTGPGLALPNLVHGGPGRAGGGLELGGLRGLGLYLQTCAVQGSRPVLERLFAEGP